jgi:dGTPase
LEVAQIARTVARALRLNEDLTEAIALGHDLGHTPFGHAGEAALNDCYKFDHAEHGRRVVDVLEYDFKGMNLTFEVRDGISNHTSDGNPSTLEGKVVCYADKIAYINHDIDDAVRGGILKPSDIPQEYTKVLGANHGHRINNMISDLVANSYDKPKISMSAEFEAALKGVRAFMFQNVYTGSAAKAEEAKAAQMLKFLYGFFIKNPQELPKILNAYTAPLEVKVCDYIASFSDRYAITVFERYFLPKGWAGHN